MASFKASVSDVAAATCTLSLASADIAGRLTNITLACKRLLIMKIIIILPRYFQVDIAEMV